jgi:hypothetical protein
LQLLLDMFGDLRGGVGLSRFRFSKFSHVAALHFKRPPIGREASRPNKRLVRCFFQRLCDLNAAGYAYPAGWISEAGVKCEVFKAGFARL